MKMEQNIKIGYRVGSLTVEKKTKKRKNGYIVWECRCDCGRSIELDTRYLQRGTITDCGCSSVVSPGMVDLSGMRFGKLICIKPMQEKDRSGNIQWQCICDCGNICLASRAQLRAGYKKSCGCLSKPPLKDYIGKRFGKLVVLKYEGKWNGMHRWRCVCDCGNETVVGQTLLQSGKTRSCGCLRDPNVREADESNAEKTPRGFLDGTNVGMILARMNNSPISSNTSGYNGVYRNKNGVWSAQITFKGKTYYLGSFEKKSDAVTARKIGEEMYDNFLEGYYKKFPNEKKQKAK